MNATLEPDGRRAADPSLVRTTHLIYGLHALSILIGVATAATVVGMFVFGLPSIAAVIVNYVKRGEVRGTWLESHFDWQIRTFWWALLWVVVAFLVSLPLFLVLIGFLTFPLLLGIVGIWATYRIVRGWLALKDGRPVAA